MASASDAAGQAKAEARRAEAGPSIVVHRGLRVSIRVATGGGGGLVGRPYPVVRTGQRRGSEGNDEGR